MTPPNEGTMQDLNDRDPWRTRLSEYLDDNLAPSERRQLEAHLAACPACSSALDGLRAVVARATRLRTPSEPAEDLWPGIESRLQLRQARPALRVAPSMAWLAAAATLALACLATIVWLLQAGPAAPRNVAAPGPTPVAPGAAAPPTGEADRKYDDRLAELRRFVRENLTLDPQVVEVVEKNLAALDLAIAEYQDALAEQPGDEILTKRLAAARQRKLNLLQQTTALVEAGTSEAPFEER